MSKKNSNDSSNKVTFAGICIEALSSVAIALTIFAVLLTFFVRPVLVDGDSMNPTLTNADWLAIQTGFYDPEYEDIVIISREHSNEEPLVKRVIGLPGDVIDIDPIEGTVTRNGEVLNEPYIAEATRTVYDVDFPVTVPEYCVFVMGDNRNHSGDSRISSIGMITTERILGRAFIRLLPTGNPKIY